MKLKAWLSERIEAAILGNLAKGLDSGKYGPRLQKAYRFGKGKLTWTSAAFAIVFAAASAFDNTGAAEVIAQICAGLAGVGLVRKGAHMEPPQIPVEMRDALEAGCSVVVWILMAAQGLVWVCQQVGASWACGVSAEAQFVVMVATAVSGFLATYASDPKIPAKE